jgi:hypothetical protein
LSQSIYSEKSLVGKFNFTHSKDITSFNVKINLFPDVIIIQIGKPLIGNLMKININKFTGLSFYPEAQKEYSELFQIISSEDYFNFIEGCLNQKKLENMIFKNGVRLKCSTDPKGLVSISINAKELYYLNGVLKNE